MLCLSRKENESIIVGENIQITVVEIRGNSVRLGITAPSGIPVHRHEVWVRIQEEKNEEERQGNKT